MVVVAPGLLACWPGRQRRLVASVTHRRTSKQGLPPRRGAPRPAVPDRTPVK